MSFAHPHPLITPAAIRERRLGRAQFFNRSRLLVTAETASSRSTEFGTDGAAHRVRIRRATLNDVDAVAHICQQVFSRADDSSSSSSSSSRGGNGIEEVLTGILKPPRTLEAWQQQITNALSSKHTAMQYSRQYRQRRVLEQRAYVALAQQRGLQVHASALESWPETPDQRAEVQRWRRQRQFMLLVAEDPASGELLGTAALTLAQPEAALPAPFPSSKPRRAYCSNTAVLPAARRRGVARQLLRAVERVTRAWHYDALFLHVELDNTAAVRLYHSLGFEEVKRDPALGRPRRCLLRKAVQPCGQGQRRTAATAAAVAAGTGAAGSAAGAAAQAQQPTVEGQLSDVGVFVWQLKSSQDSEP